MSVNSNARYFGKWEPIPEELRYSKKDRQVEWMARAAILDDWELYGFIPPPGPKRAFLERWVAQYKRITSDPKYVPGKLTGRFPRRARKEAK